MADYSFIQNIHVADHGGSGPPAVLVHGLGGSHINWSRVAHRLGTHSVALDLPGFGLSPPTSPCDLSAHTAAVKLVGDAVGGPVFLVGNSMGGLVSMITAAEHPDLVRGLVLVDPAVPLARGTRPPDARITTRLFLQSLPVIGAAITDGYRNRMTPREQVALTLGAITARPESVPPEAIDEAVDMARLRRGFPWVGRAFQESAASTRSLLLSPSRFRDIVTRISAPTLLVWGTCDPVAAPAAMEAVASLRPDWTTAPFEGIGHVPQLEAPELFVDTVSNWFARV